MKAVILKSKNLVLRHIKMSDVGNYYKCRIDSVTKKVFVYFLKDLNDAKKRLRNQLLKMNKKKLEVEFFVIEVNGEFAGMIWVNDISYGDFKHKANIGYVISKKFRGKGFGTEALKLVTRHAFKKYKLKRLEAVTRTFNKASARILEKSGFKLEGILRKNKYKDGKYFDEMLWSKIK